MMDLNQFINSRFAYHFTSIDNLSSILEHGLKSKNDKDKNNIIHVNVAEENIQERRSGISIKTSGRFLHDYIPFYFAKRSPMLFSVISKKNVDQEYIIYIAIPLRILKEREGVIFSDKAANGIELPNFYDKNNLEHISDLNWNLIDSNKYPKAEEKRAKMAELLVPDYLNINEISYIVVWNESYKKMVENIFEKFKLNIPVIKFDPMHYFAEYPEWKYSVVCGPRQLKKYFNQSLVFINNNLGHEKKYCDLKVILKNISHDFSMIDELNDIVDLNVNYYPHFESVDKHTRNVVNNLAKVEGYSDLDDRDKDLLELAAYLHDIGKGPKNRWLNCVMNKSDPNHPKKSLPMLERIFSEEIGGMSKDEIRLIVLLVTYDDLMGDIISKKRDRKQIHEIIENEKEIILLSILSKADIMAINYSWFEDTSSEIDQLASEILGKLKAEV